jgi:FAD/FMN-containing dehydrogenase
MVVLTTLIVLFVALGAAIIILIKSNTRSTSGVIESSDDASVLQRYATDVSWFTQTPKKVFYPKNTAEVATIVKAAQARKSAWDHVSVTVRAGGTCMSGGSLTDDTVIDMTKHMTHYSVDPITKTATAEMGVYFRDIEDEAKKHGLMFAGYPSSHRICGIAGMIGNNASGEKSLRGGATGDNIQSLEVVYADGTVHTVEPKSLDTIAEKEEHALFSIFKEYGESLRGMHAGIKKAAAGYRLDKVVRGNTFNAIPLFAGSQGTLGIITKATLSLVSTPVHTKLIVVSATALEKLNGAVQIALHHNAESLETFDKHTFEKACEHLREHADKLLPFVDSTAELFVLMQFSEETLEDTEAVTEACLKELLAASYHARLITDKDTEASAWQVRRNSFLLMRDHNEEGFRAFPCIEDVIVPPEKIGEFVDGLLPILGKWATHYGFHGHIGDGSLRIVPVFDFRKEPPLHQIFGLMDDTFALVKCLGGSISADHSDGIIRTPFLESFYGKDIAEAFRKVKTVYDPHNILNPGKKVGGTREDIKRLLKV